MLLYQYLADAHFFVATFSDKKMKGVSMEHQPSGRSVMMIMEGNQLAADRGVEEEKEISDGDYEEIFFNRPFGMEYNMSYSMVTQTAM